MAEIYEENTNSYAEDNAEFVIDTNTSADIKDNEPLLETTSYAVSVAPSPLGSEAASYLIATLFNRATTYMLTR